MDNYFEPIYNYDSEDEPELIIINSPINLYLPEPDEKVPLSLNSNPSETALPRHPSVSTVLPRHPLVSTVIDRLELRKARRQQIRNGVNPAIPTSNTANISNSVSRSVSRSVSSSVSRSVQEPIKFTDTAPKVTDKKVVSDSGESKSHKFNFAIDETKFAPDDLLIDPLTQIFVEYSKFTNDELIKYHLVKHKIMEYKCSGISCPTKGGLWRRKPCFLILHRRNGLTRDLRINNLSLICPNCYCQDKGAQLFSQEKQKLTKSCVLCGYELNSKYKTDKCIKCNSNIKTLVQKTVDYQRFHDLIKDDFPDDENTQILQQSLFGSGLSSASTPYTPNNKPRATASLGANKQHFNILNTAELNINISSDLLSALNDI